MSFNRYDLKQKMPQNAALYIFIGLVVLFFVTQSYTIIEPGYRGVSIILGDAQDGFLPEGLNFKLPFIERVVHMPIKQQTRQGVASSYSSDLQTVDVQYKALYRFPESRVVDLITKIQGNPFEELVEPRIQDAIKQVTSQYRAEDLVKNREQVKKKTLEIVRRSMKANWDQELSTMTDEELDALSRRDVQPWVYLVDLPIENIDLTKELEQAIELKQIKEQEALAKDYELKKAQKQAEIVVVEAKAEADAVRLKGEALKRAPEVIELEIVKKWDGKSPATVVTGKGGGQRPVAAPLAGGWHLVPKGNPGTVWFRGMRLSQICDSFRDCPDA